MKRWLVLGGAALLLLLLAAAGVYVALELRAAEDVRGSSTEEFVTTAAPKPKPPPKPGIEWPTYGFDEVRNRISPYRHRPPYRVVWGFPGRTLIEFPPVIAYGRLYFANNDGVLFAVSTRNGKLAWRFDSGRVQAASPAIAGGTVYHTFLYRRGQAKDKRDGELVALDADTGKVRWRRALAPSESSPLVHIGRVYVGDWSGKVYCFAAASGRLLWTYRTGAEVKGAVTATGRRLFVGSYDHHFYALDALTGKLLWRSSVQERLGARGRFYSTPSAAYGRVYVGSTDGKVYSYGATTGELRWSHRTGGYVYGAPAVWQGRVFVGSYDSRFYAFDAATGDVLWRFEANGPISGSSTVVDGLVYFATLKRRTYALDARNGRQVWTFPDGEYTPVVTDRDKLYVVGKARVYALVSRVRSGR